MANVVPQTAALNRNVWEGIESPVRHLAEQQGGLYVVTGPLFQGNQLKSLKGHVLVPSSTWKTVYDPAIQGAAAYSRTNVTRPRCITLSIAALEQETGLDPFPAVSAAIKQTAMPLPPPTPNVYGYKRHPRHRRLFAPRFP